MKVYIHVKMWYLVSSDADIGGDSRLSNNTIFVGVSDAGICGDGCS